MTDLVPLAVQADRLSHLTHDLSLCCQSKEEQIFAKFGLSVAEGRVLQAVANTGASNPSDVARALTLGRSRLTPLVVGLVNKKLLKRAESEEDRRVRTLTLTPAGRKVAREVTDFQITFHENLLLRFASEEREHLFGVLNRLHGAIEELKEGLRAEEGLRDNG
jgi:MarR family transcriptional regulator, lower aerobic nicotinate degradation pathway regulator